MDKNKKVDWRYWCSYSILFFLFFGAIFCVFPQKGRAMIRLADGLNQYYYTLCYYSKLLRGILTGGKVPMLEQGIGYGADILTSLVYYGVGDPLNLLCVFFDAEHMQDCFAILLIVRLFLAGALFSKVVRNHGASVYGALSASMIYLFSGYTIHMVIKWRQFAVPLMCFPLVALGIDRILAKKKPYLFIFSVFLCVISNFYFFYMISIFMVLYAAFRYFGGERGKGRAYVWETIRLILRFAGYYAIGVLLSMPIFLPILKAFSETGRRNLQYAVPLIGSPIQYAVMAVRLFWGFGGGVLGYTFLLMPVIVCVLLRKEKCRYAVVVAVMAVLMAIPFFSSAFNGFAYVSERWYWFIAFTFAYLIAMHFETLLELRMAEKIIVTAALILLQAALYVLADGFLWGTLVSAGVMTAVLWFSHRIPKHAASWIIIACCMFSIVYTSRRDYLHSALVDESIVNYIKTDTAQNVEQGGVLSLFEEYAEQQGEAAADGRMEKREFYLLGEKNRSLLSGNRGMEFYFSIYNENVAEFYRDLAIWSLSDCDYSGTTARYILSNLLGGTYLISEDSTYRQYGYQPVLVDEARGVILKNDREPMFGYTYQNCIRKTDWLEMPFEERQYVLLQAAVLEDKDFERERASRSANTWEPEMTAERVAYEIENTDGDGIICRSGEWCVNDVQKAARLRMDKTLSGEIYVIFKGIDYKTDAGRCPITVRTEHGRTASIVYIDDASLAYTGRHDFLCNVGYEDEGITWLEISFDIPGTYTFDEIAVVRQPLDAAEDHLDQLAQESLRNVVFATNELRGKISVTGNKILCLPYAYSEGWSAYVNGKKQPVLRVNDMMLGIALCEGTYEIRLCYTTPGLKAGIWLALAGLAAVIGLVWYHSGKLRIK